MRSIETLCGRDADTREQMLRAMKNGDAATGIFFDNLAQNTDR